ncbi:MAG TPA: ABC transporter permease [Planctomycetaceae bacterium]|nr:ABC transporter permease [Planctomycetaceae bacterium]
MFAQTLAFLTRSIRQESRLLTHHAVRGSLVLLTVFLFFSQVIDAPRRGASGLYLVSSISNCCYFCLTLLGVMYFSLAITEEKEEETLPLLRMTGVRNFTLLIGKSLPRLAVVVLLILVSAPFLLLSITLGGVIPEQIIALILGMMCYAFCLSQMGLFSSTICRSSQRAVSLTFVLWLVMEFGGWLLYLIAYGCQQWEFFWLYEFLNTIAGSILHWSMWSASSDFLMFERGESVWHGQMTFHICTGLGFFGVSWLLFEFANQASLAQGASASEDITRGIVSKSNSLRSLRCWDAAIVWKSWQFLVGGWLWIIVYSIGLPLFAVSMVLLISILVGESANAEVYGMTLMTVGGASFVILLARLFGNVLNREIYQQTLVSLCMLPRRRWVTIGELYLGLLPGLIAPLFCFVLGVLWTGLCEPWFFQNFFEMLLEPWCWAVLGWLMLTAHIGTLLSVYLRHGAMLIAVAVCWFLTPFVFGMVFGIISLVFRGLGADLTEIIMRYMLPVAIIGGEFTGCGLIHRWILFRFEELAAK